MSMEKVQLEHKSDLIELKLKIKPGQGDVNSTAAEA